MTVKFWTMTLMDDELQPSLEICDDVKLRLASQISAELGQPEIKRECKQKVEDPEFSVFYFI